LLLLLRSPNRIQAYVLRDILRMHGIATHVFNEHMSSIVGDVPPEVALPQLWLDDEADLPRAREVLREHFAASRRRGVLFCPRCREENPANFEVCWNCGAEL
jgi:hypothetical protein